MRNRWSLQGAYGNEAFKEEFLVEVSTFLSLKTCGKILMDVVEMVHQQCLGTIRVSSYCRSKLKTEGVHCTLRWHPYRPEHCQIPSNILAVGTNTSFYQAGTFNSRIFKNIRKDLDSDNQLREMLLKEHLNL